MELKRESNNVYSLEELHVVTKGPQHLTHPLVCLLSVFLQIYSFKKGGQKRNLPRTALRNLSDFSQR
ncbi:poly [ADP-ribose] polymerase 7/11/12/13 [Sarotherodon galilaeus]